MLKIRRGFVSFRQRKFLKVKPLLKSVTFVKTIIALKFQVSNKRITNGTYIIEQCSKPCVAKPYVLNQITRKTI